VKATIKHKRRPKLRRARQSDRDHAAELARLFWSQEPVILASGGPPDREEWRPIDGNDLARALDHFAREGTFSSPEGRRAARSIVLPLRFAELRAAGETYEIAIEKCTEEFDCSETTARETVKRRTAKR
jgi:hypothetical protein